jgi:hypothetical protein
MEGSQGIEFTIHWLKVRLAYNGDSLCVGPSPVHDFRCSKEFVDGHGRHSGGWFSRFFDSMCAYWELD